MVKAQAQLYSFFNLGARWIMVVLPTPRPLYTRKKDTDPTVQDAVWASAPIWMGAKKSRLHRASNP